MRVSIPFRSRRKRWLHNAPGAEVGPGQVATWATAKEDEVEAFGFKWSWPGRSSKHFPFEWSSEDEF
jgi:hypothetical protein